MMALSLDRTTPTDIGGITNGGRANINDEAGAKAYGYSVWDDDWSE